MGVVSKNLEFNHGDVIDFEIIKENREQAVMEISEGNKGLENLLNVCIDNNIKTHSSCGDRTPRICFIIDDENREKLINLFTVLDSFCNDDRKIFYVELIKNDIIDKLLLNINILTSVKQSVVYFNYIAQILDSEILYNKNEKFDIMENFIYLMFTYADHVCLGLKYARNEFRYDCSKNKHLFCNYDVNLYVSYSRTNDDKIYNYVIDNADYCFRDFGVFDCGIVSIERLNDFINYINEEKNKKGIIKRIKNLF